jgi:hypothetical protein
VLLSVVIHGGSQVFLRPAPAGAAAEAPPVPPPAVATVPEGAAALDRGDPERITLEELDGLERRGEQVALLDVRTEGAYRESSERARGAVRVPPDRPVEVVGAWGLPPDAWLVSYCT